MSIETPVATAIPPPLSRDVRVSEPDAAGVSIAKNQRKQRYVRLGAEESFLLSMLDGHSTYGDVASRFQDRFCEPISCEEVHEFVSLVKKEGLLATSAEREQGLDPSEHPQATPSESLVRRCITAARKQSLLFFRVKLFDPNETLNRLEPRTRFLFSPTLAVLALAAGVMALGVVWIDRGQLAQQFTTNFGWRAFGVAWLTTIVITIFHEFGHGLACKRYGGDVHEMGALWIFFTPCFYCNVSDAWLLPSRWQRLLVSLAGTYIDFLVWIAAVFVWRITAPESAVNFAAWVIISTCGMRVAFNLNPLMRLDGYYALCDLLHTHNLRRRARNHCLGYSRWILWGGDKPEPHAEHATLVAYGITNWIFSVGFLGVMSFQASLYLRSMLGIGGIIAAVGLFSLLTKSYFKGSLGEDFKIMFRARKARVLIGLGLLGAILAIPIHDRAGGEFHLRPVTRREVRAPIAGFLQDIAADEGDLVSRDSQLVFVAVPELVSKIARQKSEIAESEAVLRRLMCGPREEEVHEQKQRIKRATSWRDLAKSDLEKARRSFAEELASLKLAVRQADSQREFRAQILEQMQSLYDQGGLAGQQLLTYKRNQQEAVLAASQAEAVMRSREAEGVIRYEAELARREKELADAEAALTLLEAGSRPEDIDAERARLQRLQEELNHLLEQQQKQVVRCPVSGTIVTPRFREKIGAYVERGTPLCVIEDLQSLEAEISVPEKDARVLVTGHPITLKPRALPFTTLDATVDRIAPAAQPNSAQPNTAGSLRTVTVYCTLDNSAGALRTGMTGFARIRSDRRPLGVLLFNAGVRLLRTEFFW